MNLNPYALIALVLLGIAATAQYFFGRKKNRALLSKLTEGLEAELKPTHTNYVNIGGAIGYNFVYALTNGPWTSAKGTITMSPRHSLLYMPISRLLGFNDRFYINLYTKKKLRGEAHLISRSQLRRTRIDGIQEMSRKDLDTEAGRFVLLWRGADLQADLEAVFEAMPDPSRLRHFCAFPDNKTFYLFTIPAQGAAREDVEALMHKLPRFLDIKKEA